MDDIERILREAQHTSRAPALRPGTARLVLRRCRRQRRLQAASAGGAAAAVIVTGAVALSGPRTSDADVHPAGRRRRAAQPSQPRRSR